MYLLLPLASLYCIQPAKFNSKLSLLAFSNILTEMPTNDLYVSPLSRIGMLGKLTSSFAKLKRGFAHLIFYIISVLSTNVFN